MKKFTLKELIDRGDSLTELPEQILCWVDLPWTDVVNKSASFGENKSKETSPAGLYYRVCKQTGENGLFYSFRKVIYDNNGKIKLWSQHPIELVARENCNSKGLAFLRSELAEYLKAFEGPTVNLDEIKKERKI
jgi:hypothetical protein